MDHDGAGPSRVPPYPPYPFDPAAFPMIPPPPQGMRFPPPPIPSLPEDLKMDEHGNVDWHLAWVNELQQLQNVTAEQEKAGIDQEWYRMMLFRIRSAMLLPPLPPGDHLAGPPPMQPLQGEVSPDGQHA